MKTGSIYLITNSINSKVYVGQTVKSLKVRLGKHFQDPSNLHLERAFNKYGKSAFVMTLLEGNLPYDQLDERERYWINFYKSNNPDIGYNKDTGGNARKIVTEDVKKRIGEASRKLWNKPGFREQQKKSRTGLKVPSRGRTNNNHRGRKVINISTGEIFENTIKAAEAIGMKRRALSAQLTGQNPNKTSLRFLEQD